MASPQPALRQSRDSHIQLADERCPECDQPIPNEKAEEIRDRMKARERVLTETANARAAEQIAREKAQIEANAQAAVEKIRKEGAEALQKALGEIAAKEAAARAAGKKEADAALEERLAAAERAKAASDAAAQERIAVLEQAGEAREADWQEKIAAAERDKQGTLGQYEALKADHEKVVNERVQEVREAMETAKTSALNAERANHFDEKQKLTGKLEALTRQLENKTADELGEGAEVNLFEVLKREFEGDRIDRIRKGVSGADIIHTVIHNGQECGKIIYDCKNSMAWRDDYVSKLAQDQTAAKADHAMLCTFKLPANARQVDVRHGVVIANPARALALVQMIRRHIVQVHTLRLSKSERAQKMAALYDFITSERCGHLLARIESHAEALLELQEKEMKAHQAHWKHEGTHLRSIQKVKAELETEIDCIIGTDDAGA